jgi:hypothetical protein
MVRATMAALRMLKRPDAVAALRGKTLAELRPERTKTAAGSGA